MGTCSAANLTAVIVAYRKNRFNHRLLFGEPVFRVRRGWRRDVAAFEPGVVFGYERWQANQYGTQDWRLYVCLSASGGSIAPVPGILPGAEILLSAIGKTQVKRALYAIDDVSKDYCRLPSVPLHTWRSIHNSVHTTANRWFRHGAGRCG